VHQRALLMSLDRLPVTAADNDTAMVIADADQSLANFLSSSLPKGTAVVFDTPSDDFAKSVKKPTVSCFLHRIVEDIERRAADWMDERGENGRVAGRQPPVRHYQLHYQVSAWAPSVSDEHGLLGSVMHACLHGEVLPPEHLAGSLADYEDPVLLRLGLPMADPGPQPHDVWSSLGVPLRASIELMLVAPLRPQLDTDLAPPAEELTLGMEAIGPTRRTDAGPTDQSTLTERRWTTFRIREKSSQQP
jgi:Pvc16 N-terminal domain